MNIIGLDIGGTKISGIVWDGKKVLDELTVVTPKNLFEFERNLLKLADFLSAKRKITGVGVGIAGLVDDKRGIVKYSPNIKFINNLDLLKFFRLNRFRNVKIDNDANCFTRAEMLAGQGKKFDNFLALTLGTGIGGGIVIDGKLYRGAENFGAELGHIVLNNEFWETAYQRARDKRDFKTVGSLLGQAAASLINIFAPEAIIIGGNLGRNERNKYMPGTKKQYDKFLFNRKSKAKILISNLKNAGSIGAALLLTN